jgi:hypothetical protein
MDEIVKIGLIGLGAYVVYNYLIAPAAVTTTTGTAPVTTPVTTVAAPVITTSADQAAAGAAGLTGTIWQWNYYANVGQLIIGPTSSGLNWSGPWTLAQYQSFLTLPTTVLIPQTVAPISVPTAVSASSNAMAGLGLLIDLTTLYSGSSPNGVGAKEFSAKQGLGLLVDDSLMSAAYIDEDPFNEAAAWNGSQSDITTADFYLAASGAGS